MNLNNDGTSSGTNKWFTELFEGGAWVPVYVNHKFWAGMTTTQRAESIHAFFKRYITKKASLSKFVEHRAYKAVGERV
jgi:hypothetical protein